VAHARFCHSAGDDFQDTTVKNNGAMTGFGQDARRQFFAVSDFLNKCRLTKSSSPFSS
jgi:hypothetical protein